MNTIRATICALGITLVLAMPGIAAPFDLTLASPPLKGERYRCQLVNLDLVPLTYTLQIFNGLGAVLVEDVGEVLQPYETGWDTYLLVFQGAFQ